MGAGEMRRSSQFILSMVIVACLISACGIPGKTTCNSPCPEPDPGPLMGSDGLYSIVSFQEFRHSPANKIKSLSDSHFGDAATTATSVTIGKPSLTIDKSASLLTVSYPVTKTVWTITSTTSWVTTSTVVTENWKIRNIDFSNFGLRERGEECAQSPYVCLDQN